MSFLIVDGFLHDPRSMDEYMRDIERNEYESSQEQSQVPATRTTEKPPAHRPAGKRPTRPIGRRYS